MPANLKRRLITALIGLPLLMVVVGWGASWVFSTVIVFLSAVALVEFSAMALPSRPLERGWIVLWGTVVCGLFAFPVAEGPADWAAIVLVIHLLGCLLFRGTLAEKLNGLNRGLLGIVYIGFLLPQWAMLFSPSERTFVGCFVLGIIMTGDSAAFFAGNRFGGRKLAPEISPGKTVAGAWGYLAGGVAAGLLLGLYFLREQPVIQIVALACCLSVIGQLGDLFESFLKRVFSVKDSSGLLPGHGGLLDRLDSLIFPAVFTTAYLKVFQL